jgi:hypothetical protein
MVGCQSDRQATTAEEDGARQQGERVEGGYRKLSRDRDSPAGIVVVYHGG